MKINIYSERNYCNLYIIKISENMDTDVDTDVDTTISIEPIDLSSPTLIDVIDLTEESPRNRPSQSCNRCAENTSMNHHVTRSSRRFSHRGIIPPIVLGRTYNILPFV